MKILFQGDSITDAGRARDNDDYLGRGYPALVKSTLNFEEPNKYEFFNRGVSGNRVVDLYARLKADIINLNPDVMSILIGVNDVWHEYDFENKPNGVDAEKFFKIYSMLIEEVKEALPNIKIMIMEPFTLEGTGNEAYYAEFKKEVLKRAEKARAIAEKYRLAYMKQFVRVFQKSRRVVFGDHHGDSEFFVYRREHRNERFAADGVEARRRLVEQKQFG